MMKRRTLNILLGVIALVVVLVIGAAGGAAISTAFLDVQPAKAAIRFASEVQSEEGVLISSVAEGSAAAEAGLVRGDILMAVDGQEVNSLPELWDVLAGYEPGATVELTVLHGDDTRTPEANLGGREGEAILGISACNGFSIDEKVWVEKLEGDLADFSIAVGAKVITVTPDSPAEEAGLVAGDLILSVDGVEISLENELAEVIQSHDPGDTVTLEVLSSGDEEPHEVKVVLAQHPNKEDLAYLGVKYRWGPGFPAGELKFIPRMPFFFHLEEFDHQFPEGELEGERFHFHGVPGLPWIPLEHDEIELPEGVESAAIIGEVLPDSPAEEAGLKAGDVVFLLDGEPIEYSEDLSERVRALAPGDEITLTIYRDGEVILVAVTLGEHPDDPGVGYLGVSVVGFIKIEGGGLPPDLNEGHFEKRFKMPAGEA